MSYQPIGPNALQLPQQFPQLTKTTVIIDSRDRNFFAHPSSSRFVVQLPEPLKNVTHAVMVSAELPLTYYVFSQKRKNTTLRVRVGTGAWADVTIRDGNYTNDTMAAELKRALQAAFPNTFTVSIDPGTMLCTISVDGTTLSVDTTGPTRPTDWGLGYFLGLERGVVTPPLSSITGTRVCMLNPENYLLVFVEQLNGILQNEMYGTGVGPEAFAKVPLNGSNYDYSYYDKALTGVQLRPSIANLTSLDVAIKFHGGEPVDLNGADWSMAIEFTCTHTRSS